MGVAHTVGHQLHEMNVFHKNFLTYSRIMKSHLLSQIFPLSKNTDLLCLKSKRHYYVYFCIRMYVLVTITLKSFKCCKYKQGGYLSTGRCISTFVFEIF